MWTDVFERLREAVLTGAPQAEIEHLAEKEQTELVPLDDEQFGPWKDWRSPGGVLDAHRQAATMGH